MKVRPSVLDAECPHRAEHDERGDESVFVYGSAVHKAFELWREPPEDPWDGGPMDPYTLDMAWDAVVVMDEFTGNRPGEGQGNTLRYEDIGRGTEELAKWAAQIETNRPNVLATEWKFTLTIGDHTIDGTVDAVDQEGCILVIGDYKTGHGRYDAHKSAQLSAYGIAAAQAWRWSGKIRLEFRCTTTGVRRWRYTTLENLLRHDAPRIERLISRWESFNDSGNFPRRRNQFCSFCSLKEDCEQYTEPKIPKFETIIDEYRHLVLTAKLAKKRIDELAPAILKAFPREKKTHRGVQRYPKKKRTVDVERLLDTVKLEDLRSVGAIKTISVTALDKLQTRRPDLIEDITNSVQTEYNELVRRVKD